MALFASAARAGDSPGLRHENLAYGFAGAAAQAGTFGDIQQPFGWLFGGQIEHVSPRNRLGYFGGVEVMRFDSRPDGHVISSTGDTLLSGAVGDLLLYEGGIRGYLRLRDHFRTYYMLGAELAVGSLPYTTSADSGFGGAP